MAKKRKASLSAKQKREAKKIAADYIKRGYPKMIAEKIAMASVAETAGKKRKKKVKKAKRRAGMKMRRAGRKIKRATARKGRAIRRKARRGARKVRRGRRAVRRAARRRK